jgi:predicted nuclease of predicted toxin-antitoxin system
MLLFDQNLSPRLVTLLADLYPGSTHVARVGLDRAQDLEVWTYAREQNFAIVTRDADFTDLSLVRGFPPEIVWIRRGNCTTREIELLLRLHAAAVLELCRDPAVGILMLS